MEQAKQTNLEEDWRADITEAKDQMKLKDGDAFVVTFLDEGVRNTNERRDKRQ